MERAQSLLPARGPSGMDVNPCIEDLALTGALEHRFSPGGKPRMVQWESNGTISIYRVFRKAE